MAFSETLLQRSLLGLVGFGFIAWAGVVWRATGDIDVMAQSIIRQDEVLARHVEAPFGHSESAHLVRRNAEVLQRIEDRLERIEGRLTKNELLRHKLGKVAQ